MIAVILAVFLNTRREYCWHFSGRPTWISRSKINASRFLVTTTFGAQFVFHLYFCQSLPTLQRGLSATADLLVSYSLNEKVQEKHGLVQNINVPVFRNFNQINHIKFICDKKEHNATHKKQSKYVDRTQRQYEIALTSALQNKTLQQEFKFNNSTLKTGRGNNIIRKRVPCIKFRFCKLAFKLAILMFRY